MILRFMGWKYLGRLGPRDATETTATDVTQEIYWQIDKPSGCGNGGGKEGRGEGRKEKGREEGRRKRDDRGRWNLLKGYESWASHWVAGSW